jgi:hydrogenase/urease accessory protein HupE
VFPAYVVRQTHEAMLWVVNGVNLPVLHVAVVAQVVVVALLTLVAGAYNRPAVAAIAAVAVVDGGGVRHGYTGGCSGRSVYRRYRLSWLRLALTAQPHVNRARPQHALALHAPKVEGVV